MEAKNCASSGPCCPEDHEHNELYEATNLDFDSEDQALEELIFEPRTKARDLPSHPKVETMPVIVLNKCEAPRGGPTTLQGRYTAANIVQLRLEARASESTDASSKSAEAVSTPER